LEKFMPDSPFANIGADLRKRVVAQYDYFSALGQKIRENGKRSEDESVPEVYCKIMCAALNKISQGINDGSTDTFTAGLKGLLEHLEAGVKNKAISVAITAEEVAGLREIAGERTAAFPSFAQTLKKPGAVETPSQEKPIKPNQRLR